MKADELQTLLGIKPAKLRKWIKEGLPCKRRGRSTTFDAAAVEQWLLDTGRAQKEAAPPPAGVVARTIAEAAKLCDVSSRVFADWLKQPAFPGKPGSPGRRDGYFPIAEIEAWRVVRFGADGRSGAVDDGEKAVRREILEIDRDRKRAELERDVLGSLIDAEQNSQFIAFICATAKGVLQELPDRLLAKFAGMSEKRRRFIRRETRKVVREVLEIFAQLVKGDDDAKDDS